MDIESNKWSNGLMINVQLSVAQQETKQKLFLSYTNVVFNEKVELTNEDREINGHFHKISYDLDKNFVSDLYCFIL